MEAGIALVCDFASNPNVGKARAVSPMDLIAALRVVIIDRVSALRIKGKNSRNRNYFEIPAGSNISILYIR